MGSGSTSYNPRARQCGEFAHPQDTESQNYLGWKARVLAQAPGVFGKVFLSALLAAPAGPGSRLLVADVATELYFSIVWN